MESFQPDVQTASNVLNLYVPKTSKRDHIRKHGHKQQIIEGVRSVKRFNKITLGEKEILLNINRALVKYFREAPFVSVSIDATSRDAADADTACLLLRNKKRALASSSAT